MERPDPVTLQVAQETTPQFKLQYASSVANPVEVDKILFYPAYTQTDIDTDSDDIFNNVDLCPIDNNSDNNDFDNDGLGDICDMDIDNDGIFNPLEITIGTDAYNPDSDGDGDGDGFEIGYDGNTTAYNPATDLNPFNADTDNDGYSDATETTLGSDPLLNTSTPSIIPDGDINLDGDVNTADVLLAQRALLAFVTLSAEQIDHGDFRPAPSGDSQLTLPDLIIIMKIALDVQ